MSIWSRLFKSLTDPKRVVRPDVPGARMPSPPCTPDLPRDPEPVKPPDPGSDVWPDPGLPSGRSGKKRK
jgi:hypothetical protein